MILDAASLTRFQGCKRSYLLALDWQVRLWSPKRLFDSILRRSIFDLSSGTDIDLVASSARERFLSTAADPGLDARGNTYELAKDWCALLETILRTLPKITLLALAEVPNARLSSLAEWRFSSHADDSGTLHRWITVDRWDEDALAREMHGWYTFGDIAVAGQGMVLHAIEIGQQRHGHHATSWTRAYRHPGLPNLKMHFRRRDGRKFQGWDPVYLADDPRANVQAWVDQAWAEGATPLLLHHVTVNPPPDDVCADTRAQMLMEVLRMRELAEERASQPWHTQAMSRGQCDLWVPCPYQYCCHAPRLVDPRETGLYDRRDAPARDRKQDDVRSKAIPVVL